MSYMEMEVRARKAQGMDNAFIARSIGIDEARVERCLLGEHVVRVVHPVFMNDITSFLEHLPIGSFLQIHRVSNGTICLDVLPPKDQPSKEWAEEVVKDLATKNFNAVVAPRWADA